MAASPPIVEPEPGAPVPRDAIDPDLVRLGRARSKIGAITAAAVVGLCLYFLFIWLSPHRRFAGEPPEPRAVALADVAAGQVASDSFVSLEADPMMSYAIRVKGGESEVRVTPARGTNERVWLVLSSDGWSRPVLKAYTGRLRKLDELPFASLIDTHIKSFPRPLFANAAGVRAGLGGGQVTTVTGDKIAVGDGDKVAFDVVEPARATVIASFTGKRDAAEGDPGHGPLTDAKLWIAELAKHGITATASPTPGQADAIIGQARLDVAMPVADVTQKLEAAKLWAARVERVTRHHETTWGALRGSPAGAFTVGGEAIPEAQVDLVGLFVRHGIPGDAYALVADEKPQDYWHILPLTVALAVIGLFFAWALVRAIRAMLPMRVPQLRQ
ncbi:MAG TPA: hypothetical protein VNO30_24240 [Kofleriaceae bacterium]|nr:hypothetical protein [Kofleriaceae bacterium]